MFVCFKVTFLKKIKWMCAYYWRLGKYKIKGKCKSRLQSHGHRTGPQTKPSLTISHLDDGWSYPNLNPCLRQVDPHLSTYHPHCFQDEEALNFTNVMRSPCWTAMPYPLTLSYCMKYANTPWCFERYSPHLT